MDEGVAAPRRAPVETRYTASREVARREADALATWLLHRPGRGRRLARRVGGLTAGLLLVAAGMVLVVDVAPVPTAGFFGGCAVLLAAFEVLGAPALTRRRCRRFVSSRVMPGSESRAAFTPATLELRTPGVDRRIDLANVVHAARVGPDLVLETPGPSVLVVVGELLTPEADGVLEAALGDRLRRLR
ncbi:hypothetical protein [Phycicoccus flavus]|uniref:Uncharacterized protein n=1 Tax=Phycicoccus flavus TaxID=2502783 RepID=A0A8T6R7G2_9MICO|nr:hypothetical protein [Phycicoccus flavus]NHA69728.1 hypothetical protein [Phycicoccus flavus]NHA69927.1 hypothetical protein [Phycicoccus flavus]